MGYVFPEELIEEVKTANDVYDVISEYVPLKKSGHTYKGLCPFHSEKTPSFFVNPERQIFHCFGCGAGGNVYTFLMRYENISFPEAVKQLALKRGISLPVVERGDNPEAGWRKRMLDVNTKALEFFQKQLASAGGEPARRYLADRGIGAQDVARFRIGWSPGEWEALHAHMRRSGVADELLVKAGLIVPRQGGSGHYDRFRGRVIFPIADAQGETVAFGGRTIDKEGEPKYINSPETPLYHKGKILYGLDQARGRIREAGYAVVVEGYLDLITAHLAGAVNTVATLGTALTLDHLRLLKRYTGKVVVFYDGDAAGVEATKRSLELFLEEELTVNTATLPEKHDPDSLIRAQGAEAFQKLLRNSVNLMDFFIDSTTRKWRGEGIDGKAKAAREIIPLLGRIPSHIKRSEYARRVAMLLDIREDALLAELKESMASRHGGAAGRPAPKLPARRRPTEEEELVRAMLSDTGLAARIKDEVPLPSFRDDACRAVAAAVYADLEKEPRHRASAGPSLSDIDAAALAARLMADDAGAGDLNKVVDDCLAMLRRQRLAGELRELQEKIRQAEADRNPAAVNELLKIKQSLAKA